MFVTFVTVCILSFSLPTKEHFISVQDPCYLAFTCNHTWIAECGSDKINSQKRMFFDECDRWEHNCDYNKEYLKTNIGDCKREDTANDTQVPPNKQISTKSTNDANITSTVINTTITNMTTTAFETTTLTTLCTRSPNRHTYFTCDFQNVTEPMTTEYGNATSATPANNTSTTSPTTSAKISTTIELTTKINTLSNTSMENTTEPITTANESTTTIAENSTLAVSTITTSPNTTTIETTTEPVTSTTNETNTTNISFTSTRNETTPTDIPVTSAINSSSSMNVTSQTTASTSETKKSTEFTTTNTTGVNLCSTYPEDCDRPVTWETTVDGETRDFFQILKERFGRRAMVMKHTTHFPRQLRPPSKIDEAAFVFGNHIERRHY